MKILIVDDERSVVDVLTSTVEMCFPQHSVRGAESLTEAIGVAYEEGRVDLLISDIDLGDSDGFQVRAELEQLFPKMETVFISGADLRKYAEVTDTLTILQKPLVPDEVLETVRTAEERFEADRDSPAERPASRLQHGASPMIVLGSDDLSVLPPRKAPTLVPMRTMANAPSPAPPIQPERPWLIPASIAVGLAAVVILFFRHVEFRKPVAPGQSSLALPSAAPSPTPSPGTETVAPVGEASPAAESSPRVRLASAGDAIRIADDFAGAERSLDGESQWRVHPIGQGAYDLEVGEGKLRARSSGLVCATFEAASVSAEYDWAVRVPAFQLASGTAGLVFGYRDSENFYRVGLMRPANRLSVVRRADGKDETLLEADAPSDGNASALSIEFQARDGVLILQSGDDGEPLTVDLPGFDGGKFGGFVSEAPAAEFGEFEVRLRPAL